MVFLSKLAGRIIFVIKSGEVILTYYNTEDHTITFNRARISVGYRRYSLRLPEIRVKVGEDYLSDTLNYWDKTWIWFEWKKRIKSEVSLREERNKTSKLEKALSLLMPDIEEDIVGDNEEK